MRTAFNLLGPLTNPAGAARQLVGVPRPELTELVARSLGLLGIGTRLGRPRRRRPGRDFDDRLHQGVGIPRRRGQHVLRASGGLGIAEGRARGAAGRRCGGECPDRPRRARRRAGERHATSCCSTPACRFSSPASFRISRRASAGLRARSILARPPASSAADRAVEHGTGGGVMAMTSTSHGGRRTLPICSRRSSPRPGTRLSRDGARRRSSAWSASAVRRPDGQAFRDALTRSPAPRIIAECKRRSPSRGILRRDYDSGRARGRVCARRGGGDLRADGADILRRQPRSPRAGASGGRDPASAQGLHRQRVSAASRRSRYGADAVLLIVGALDDRELRALVESRRRARAGGARRSARLGRARAGRRRGSGHHRRQQPQPSDAVGRS